MARNRRRLGTFLFGVLLLCGLRFAAHGAAEPANISVGDLPVSAFASVPKLKSIEMAPDGRYVAGIMRQDGQTMLWGIDLTGTERKPFVIGSQEDWNLSWLEWLDNDQFLVGFRTVRRVNNIPYSVTRLAAVNPRIGNVRHLLKHDTDRFNGWSQDRVLSVLPDQPDRFLLELNGRHGAYVCVVSVKRRRCLRKIHDPMKNVSRWYADHNGEIRAGEGLQDNLSRPYFTLRDASGEWHNYSQLVPEASSAFALPTDDLDTILVTSEHEQPLGALYRLHVPTKTLSKVAGNPVSAIHDVILKPDGSAIERVVYSNDFVDDTILDAELAVILRSIEAALPEHSVDVITRSHDYQRAVVEAESSSAPPHFYLYDRKQKAMAFLLSDYPRLDGRKLPEAEVLSYKARDGLEIPAYVTVPRGFELGKSKAIPFVVHPHGGPHARDFLGFDWLVQLMVQAGYGVLQMNFRGSSGYGSEFERAGYREWGEAMQDDVTDGTRWLIEQGYAKPERICIVGGSYGGYAALMGVAKVPALYRCAVSLNGVSDLVSFLEVKSVYRGWRFFYGHIGRLWKDRNKLLANSPRRLVGQISAPVLLVHGDKDSVVPVSQSRRTARVLKQAGGTVRYVELPEGDHALTSDVNRRRFGEELVAFLREHLGSTQPMAPDGR